MPGKFISIVVCHLLNESYPEFTVLVSVKWKLRLRWSCNLAKVIHPASGRGVQDGLESFTQPGYSLTLLHLGRHFAALTVCLEAEVEEASSTGAWSLRGPARYCVRERLWDSAVTEFPRLSLFHGADLRPAVLTSWA